jgi:hypothetical protein
MIGHSGGVLLFSMALLSVASYTRVQSSQKISFILELRESAMGWLTDNEKESKKIKERKPSRSENKQTVVSLCLFFGKFIRSTSSDTSLQLMTFSILMCR